MSAYQDDDLMPEFLAEARQHLSDIEVDLLAIEDAGADIDEELVNKVFRAAHSIKGGSSFLGLDKIKELAHKAETVLDMVRSRQMVPNPEVTNILLAAFDKLRDLLNNAAESENADISEHVASLNQLATSFLADKQKDSLNRMALLNDEKKSSPISISGNRSGESKKIRTVHLCNGIRPYTRHRAQGRERPGGIQRALRIRRNS